MAEHQGGCLCGDVRYSVSSPPIRVTVCHCRFCRRATGSAYLIEPIFPKSDIAMRKGVPDIYEHRSEGSGKIVRVHFCARCATKLYLSFERFPDVVGVYAGTIDDPNWFDRSAANSRHIFIDAAQHGTIIPARTNAFRQHVSPNAGEPNAPTVFDVPHRIGPVTS